MNSHRRQSKSSVSLFPFLAVLICAMGALIFLLIVTTRRIRSQAIAQACETQPGQTDQTEPSPEIPHEDELWDPLDFFAPDESTTDDIPMSSTMGEPTDTSEVASIHISETEPPPADEDVASAAESPNVPSQEDLQADWEKIVTDLTAKRDEWVQRLASQESAAEAVRKAKAAIEAALRKKETELQAANSEFHENRRISDSLHDEIIALQKQIAQLQQQLVSKRRQNIAAHSKFTFIPYDGQSGTTRRPILIECNGDSVTFLPEMVQISREELNGFTVKYNPLLAGAQTLVDFWTAWNRVHPEKGLEEKPYVLLIVRPKGSLLFYVTRAILSQLDVPYGYELIDDDWELALPDPDPRAVAACRDAVNQVLAERDHLLAFLAENRSERQGQIRMEDLVPHPDRSSRAGDNANQAVPSHATASNRALPSQRGPSNATPNGSVRNMRSAQNLRRSESTLGQAIPQQSLTYGRTGRQDAAALSASQAEKTNSESPDGSSSLSSRRLRKTPASSRLEPSVAGLPQPNRVFRPLSVMRASRAEVAMEDANAVPGQSYGEVDRNRSMKRNANGNVPNRLGRQTVNAAERPAGSVTHSSKGMPHGLNLRRTDQETSDNPIAETARHGIDWGLRRGSATIGLERRLTIEVQIDRVIVDHDSVIPIVEFQSPDELFQYTRTAMEQATRFWGDPPKSFYWIPVVHFVVRPGGIQHYERLRSRLSEQGLATTAQFPFFEQTANQFPEILDEPTHP